ncbi:MAG: hypothetical protein OCD02_19755 [Spirochaetaceae bacterium]
MTIDDIFINFNKRLIIKYDSKTYSSFLNKNPFEEIEDDGKYSCIHELIEEGYLEFISLDVRNAISTKYIVKLSDKAINKIKSLLTK